MVSVRHVAIEELPRVVDVGFSFFKEGSLPGGFVPEVFIRNWSRLLDNDQGCFIGMFDGGKFVGGLGAVLAPDLNNDQLMAIECFWYVLPEYRGRGIRMLREFERWAKSVGAVRAAMIHLTNLHPETMKLLYERRGYKAVEINYIKDL